MLLHLLYPSSSSPLFLLFSFSPFLLFSHSPPSPLSSLSLFTSSPAHALGHHRSFDYSTRLFDSVLFIPYNKYSVFIIPLGSFCSAHYRSLPEREFLASSAQAKELLAFGFGCIVESLRCAVPLAHRPFSSVRTCSTASIKNQLGCFRACLLGTG